jgi:hypothetical protein
MKWRSLFLALATTAAATLLSAQEVTTKQTTIETTSDNPRIVTITGEVVRWEPGDDRASGRTARSRPTRSAPRPRFRATSRSAGQ